MNSVIRSFILLQFVLCLPFLLAECRLTGLKIWILKTMLFLVLIVLALSDFCILEVLGIGLVLLNFVILYGRRRRSNIECKFCLLTLAFALVTFCGRIVWCGFLKFNMRKDHCCLDYSQSKINSKSNIVMTRDKPEYETRVRMVGKLLFGKNEEEVLIRKINETSQSVDFDVAPSNGTHYIVCVLKGCNKVFVKETAVDTVTNNVCLP